jgi:general transcription factor 3C polypeptide 3 (transcription factor C subunit 4)
MAILKRFPHDLTVLSELRPVLIELSDFSTCASLFQRAFEHYQTVHPSGHSVDPETAAETPGGGLGLMELLVLADLYNTLQEYDRAVLTIRRGCRWLQGRSEQRYWDVCDDDREYDVTLDGRAASGKDGKVQPGMFPLDINARHRLAIARIKMGELEEGKVRPQRTYVPSSH